MTINLKEKVVKNNFLDKSISLAINFLYSKEKKYERYLVGLIIVGFILRLIATLDLDVLADDMVHVSQSAGILSAKILSTHSNPPLFYYLTDLAFKIFGYTTFASRFWPLIFGTLLVPLSYLITLKLFNNKNIGLLASFFVTFSSFLIRNTFGEASLIILFLCFFGVYLGILFLETKKLSFLILSAVAFGLGTLTKYNAPFFIFSFLLYSVFYFKHKKEKLFTKNNIYFFILFFTIILFFCLPFLTFNYLLYKDKGITDVYFSRLIQTEKTQQIYGGLAGQGNSFKDNLFNHTNYGNYSLLFYSDVLIFIFAMIGILYLIIKKQKLPIIFISIFSLIPFVLQSAGAPLPKHFVFISFLFSTPAGYGLYNLFKKINKKIGYFLIILIILSFMMINIGNQYSTPSNYFDKSPTSQLKSYINKNVGQNDLIVFDSRIYTSRSFWLATPNHFIDQFNFIYLNQINQNISDNYKLNTNVYFVECSVQDCGWGTIKNQPELNATANSFFLYVSNITFPDKIITSNNYNKNEFFEKNGSTTFYKVYKIQIPFSPVLIAQTDKMNKFYFAPYLYKDMSDYMFNYEIKSTLDRLLNSLSYFILVFSLVIAIFLLLLFILFTLKNIFENE